MKKWRCTVCGYIHVGDEPPEKCPVCGADKSKFEEIVEAAPAAPKKESETAAAPREAVSAPPAQDAAPRPEVDAAHPFWVRQMLRHHLHPISVHIPNGVLPVSFIFIALSVVTGFVSLETAALWNMAFVVLSLPFVLFSGYIEWQKRYSGLKSGIFIAKITAAAVVTVSSVALVVWWMVDREVLQTPSMARNAFVFLGLIMLGAAGVAGHLGGKLVFKD